MIRLVALFAIFCGVLFIYGFLAAEPMTIRTISDRTSITVSITLNSVDESYRWLSVYGCSAEQTETGVYCTGDFERESTTEIFNAKKQHLFTWRHLPRGTLQIIAVAFDVDHKPLARERTVVFR